MVDQPRKSLKIFSSDGGASVVSLESESLNEAVVLPKVRRQRHRHGSLEDLVAKAHLPDGPRSVQELFPTRLRGPAAWFAHVYPKCRQPDWRAPSPIEVIQKPGETMYVPAGWWHVVINLDPLCVAVTENFGAPQDFLYIRAALRAKRKDVDVDAWERACRERWGDKIP